MKKYFMLITGLIMLCGAKAQWIPQNSGTSNCLNSIYFTDANTGYAVGKEGTILKTSDGGLNWTVQSSGTDSVLNAIYFPTALTGDGVILKTTNGGETWENLEDTLIANGNWYSVDFTDSNTGYFAGFYYSSGPWPWDEKAKACILKTFDEGNHWSFIYQDTDNHTLVSYLSSIHFISPSTGFVAGERNWDTGTTWGHTGLLFKSSNAGVDWDYVNNNLDFDSYSSLSFTDSDTGYVIGSIDLGWTNWTDTLVKTTDGGTNWSKTNIGGSGNQRINSIFFTNPDTGFLVGRHGNILKTKDGGDNYLVQNSSTTIGLNSVYFTDSNTGYIAGDSGVILKTINGGGPSTGIENPEGQRSEIKVQSYPNPTDGITHFSFLISQSQWISLKLYNAQGQEVAVELDEKLPAGEHTVRWDACGLPAGIYFYRLTTDDRRLTTGTGKIVKY
jgi:photosystem II stability/assembly factor-like uncharacterized protein